MIEQGETVLDEAKNSEHQIDEKSGRPIHWTKLYVFSVPCVQIAKENACYRNARKKTGKITRLHAKNKPEL